MVFHLSLSPQTVLACCKKEQYQFSHCHDARNSSFQKPRTVSLLLFTVLSSPSLNAFFMVTVKLWRDKCRPSAQNANNEKALPLLTAFSLLTGFTLSGIVGIAYNVAGLGSVFTAVFATGITFVIASYTGRRMSDTVGQSLQAAVGLGAIGLIAALVIGMFGSFIAPQTFAFDSPIQLMISGFGTILFIGASFLDFYTMPRRYTDNQYLAGAMGMYLTYINLFTFILRLMIALQGGNRRN